MVFEKLKMKNIEKLYILNRAMGTTLKSDANGFKSL